MMAEQIYLKQWSGWNKYKEASSKDYVFRYWDEAFDFYSYS